MHTTPESPSGPLAGVKIVELVGLGPAPFAAMQLADLGAEVIRIDRPGGNPLELAKPNKDVLARNRRTVAIDLKSTRGIEVVLDLVAQADGLIEGFRPGVAERLGVGPQDCLERNPALVYGRMTGWGQDGPLAPQAGHDVNFVSVSGALDPIGRAGGPPAIPLNLVGDFGGGSMYLVAGMLAAILHARTTGNGQVVDAAVVDGAAHLMSMAISQEQDDRWDGERGTSGLGGALPWYDLYETADHRWMALGAIEPRFWDAFVERFGVELPDREDAGQHEELRRRIGTQFATRTQAEWVEVFDGTDACVTPVVPLKEAYRHQHMAARGNFVDHEGLTQPAPTPRFSGTPTSVRIAPAPAGSHTREVLTDWGIGDVDQLIADGVAAQA